MATPFSLMDRRNSSTSSDDNDESEYGKVDPDQVNLTSDNESGSEDDDIVLNDLTQKDYSEEDNQTQVLQTNPGSKFNFSRLLALHRELCV